MWIRRLLNFGLFAALCAIIAYWVMILRAPAPAIVPSDAAVPAQQGFDAGLHARLFGGAVVNPGAGGSVRVTGVVAPTRDDTQGIALLAIDDKPPIAYSSGQTLPNGAVLREVHGERVVIDQGGARIELGVPQARPGTGSSQGTGPAGAPGPSPNPQAGAPVRPAGQAVGPAH